MFTFNGVRKLFFRRWENFQGGGGRGETYFLPEKNKKDKIFLKEYENRPIYRIC